MHRFFFLGTGCQEVHVWATGPDAGHRRAVAHPVRRPKCQTAGKHERGVPRKKNLNGKQLDFFSGQPLFAITCHFGIFGAGLGGRAGPATPPGPLPLGSLREVRVFTAPSQKKNQCKNKKSQVCVWDGVWLHLNCFRKLMKTP